MTILRNVGTLKCSPREQFEDRTHRMEVKGWGWVDEGLLTHRHMLTARLTAVIAVGAVDLH